MNLPSQNNSVQQAVEIAVNLGLIFLVVYWCFQILSPFISLIIWGAIIAISVHTPFVSAREKLGGRNKLTVVLFALLGLSIVIIPTWMFGESLIEGSQSIATSAKEGTFNIKPPSENVKDWPLIGEKLYSNWSEAASNFKAWLEENHEQVHSLVKTALAKVAGVGISLLQFIVSTLIAAALLASAESVKRGMSRCFQRLAGERGEAMMDLSVATIRSVTVGVLGIAFIQASLGGLGMMMVDVPAAGLWALLILIVAIAQLPPWIVLGPIIVYVYSKESSSVATIFMIWSVVVSFLDMVLKPMFLGRGVEAPMLVILLGAIGGMLMSGIIGLFVGAVVLALGYTLFQAWLVTGETGPDEVTMEEFDSASSTNTE